MNKRSFLTARSTLALAAAAALGATTVDVWALGLGRLNVQSALGEGLRAEIDITSLTPEEASTLVFASRRRSPIARLALTTTAFWPVPKLCWPAVPMAGLICV